MPFRILPSFRRFIRILFAPLTRCTLIVRYVEALWRMIAVSDRFFGSGGASIPSVRVWMEAATAKNFMVSEGGGDAERNEPTRTDGREEEKNMTAPL